MKYSDYSNLPKIDQEISYNKFVSNAANIVHPTTLFRDLDYPQEVKQFIKKNNIRLVNVGNALFQGLYAHCYFPHKSNNWTEVSVDDDNIYNGYATGGLLPQFNMKWTDCASSAYDGDFHLALTSPEATIRGNNEWGEFLITIKGLVYGIPPGGLAVHCNRNILNKANASCDIHRTITINDQEECWACKTQPTTPHGCRANV